MTSSKVEAMAIYLVKQTCDNDILESVYSVITYNEIWDTFKNCKNYIEYNCSAEKTYSYPSEFT